MDQDRRKACHRVLVALRNPLMVMSIPDREEVMELARKLNITAEELLAVAYNRAKEA